MISGLLKENLIKTFRTMKTKGMKSLVIVMIGIMSMTFSSYSQGDGSDWQNNETCLKNLSLYYEFFKHKNYNDAIAPWRIVFTECPDSKESLYANGVKMYRYFAEKEKDPATKAGLVDTIMMIYDQRIEYFPKNKGDILCRKGIDLLLLRRLDGEEFIQQGYNILSEGISIEKDESNPAYLTTQITAGISLFLNGSLSGETLINDYITASEIIDSRLAKRPSAKLKKAQEAINENIQESRVMTCESIVEIFGPKFEENKDNENWLNLVSGFLNDAGSCEKDPFYAQVAERRYKLNPTASAAFDLGLLFQSKSEYQKAKTYILQAIETAENNDNKADYYYRLAFLSQEYLNSPIDAAKYGYEAISLKPNWGDPYLLVGMAYVNGNSSLGEEFERRTAYWVAVDMFQKAKAVDPSVGEKASSLINSYQDYFPTKEDLFFRSIPENSSYKVEGWIQRTTSARPKN